MYQFFYKPQYTYKKEWDFRILDAPQIFLVLVALPIQAHAHPTPDGLGIPVRKINKNVDLTKK